MATLLKRLPRQIFHGAKSAFVATPVEVLIGLSVAAAFSVGIVVDNSPTWNGVWQMAMAASLAFVATFATSVMHRLEAIGTSVRWGLTAGYVGLAALYAIFVADTEQVSEVWRWALLLAAFGLGAMLTPLATGARLVDARTLAWRFNNRLLERVTVTGFYAGAMYVGLALALVAIDELFAVRLDDEVYGHLAAWIFFGGVPWMVAAGLGELVRVGEPIKERTLRWNQWFGRWLFLPLVCIYMLILYAYNARILFSGDMPSNVLSPLALGAGMVGIIGMYLLDPVHRDGEHPALSHTLRWFPGAYLPLIPMVGWALFERINQYGWTEFRYIRLLAVVGLGVCFVLGIIQVVRDKLPPVHAMPAVFAVLFFLASFGPWGALSVAERDQRDALRQDLQKAGLLTEEGKLDVAKVSTGLSVEAPLDDTIPDRVRYLSEHFGRASLAPLVPSEAPEPSVDNGVVDALGLRGLSATLDHVRFKRGTPSVPIPQKGRLFDVTYLRSGGDPSQFDGYTMTLDTNTLRLTQDQAPALEADLSRFVEMVEGDEGQGAQQDVRYEYERRTLADSQISVDLVDAQGDEQGVVIVDEVEVTRDGKRWQIENLSGFVVVFE